MGRDNTANAAADGEEGRRRVRANARMAASSNRNRRFIVDLIVSLYTHVTGSHRNQMKAVMRRLFWLLASGLLAIRPTPLSAQQVRGSVHDSTARTPIPGVVVTVLDSVGGSMGRAITDAAGRFTAPAPLTAKRLRLMRIGYRPRDLAIPEQRVDMILAMERIPPILERVQVSGRELCPGSSERGAAFQLWEQARAGLLATVVARDLKPADAKTVVYESVMSPSDGSIRRQTKSIRRGRTTRPFIAYADPQFFAANGYMTESPAGRSFFAPDADVLLHESFATTHCFRMHSADAAHLGQTGVAFVPAPGRDTLVDVSGVIWMDADGARLRSLDFTYTSLEPAAQTINPGGHIEFRTMPNGVAFIERWALRLPSVRQVQTPLGVSRVRGADPRQVRRSERSDVRIVEIIEPGGIVVEARWPDGTSWVDAPSGVSGVVTHRRGGTPVSNALVTLVGTSDSARTDSTGAFVIHAIPGRYVVRSIDTAMQAFVRPRMQNATVEVARGRIQPVQLEVPDASEYANDACRGQDMGEGDVILSGVVAMADATSVKGLRVRATWLQHVSMTTAAIGAASVKSEVVVDEEGRFLICGVKPDSRVTLQLLDGAARLSDTSFVAGASTVSRRVLWLVRRGES